MTGPKILTFDIETSPHKVYSFGTRNVNIFNEQIIEPTRMLCWAAKWLGDKRVMFRSEYHDDYQDMVTQLWELLDEADVVVTYNGDKFDLLHVNREFHELGLPPYSPIVSVDLYKVIKKKEVWASHKLAWVTQQLSLSGKLQHHGFLLWREVMGDFGEDRQRKSWNIMRRYCKQDVVTTEEVFDEYLPHITNMPAAALFLEGKREDDRPHCPTCDSDSVQRRGYRRTKTRRYPQYQCQDCGRWFSETRSDLGVSAG